MNGWKTSKCWRSVYTYRLRPVSVTVTIKFTLMDRMGSKPNLSSKRSVTIGIMVNFDGDSDGHVDGTCKRALISLSISVSQYEQGHTFISRTCANQCSSVGMTLCQVFSHQTLWGLLGEERIDTSGATGTPGDSTRCKTSLANWTFSVMWLMWLIFQNYYRP